MYLEQSLSSIPTEVNMKLVQTFKYLLADLGTYKQLNGKLMCINLIRPNIAHSINVLICRNQLYKTLHNSLSGRLGNESNQKANKNIP